MKIPMNKRKSTTLPLPPRSCVCAVFSFSWEFDIPISGERTSEENSLEEESHLPRRNFVCVVWSPPKKRKKKTLICSCNSSKIVIEALNHSFKLFAGMLMRSENKPFEIVV